MASSQTVSRTVSDASPIFRPALVNGIALLFFGAYALFNYMPIPSTKTLVKSVTNSPKNS
jgi:hypothetical protein